MNTIAENLAQIKNTLPATVTLVAVSKTKPIEAILEAYQAGHRHFAENKVQELIAKQQSLPKDIFWHFIGHLQTNKIKQIAGFVNYIHSVDSLHLLTALQKEAAKASHTINCFLQLKIAKEESKFGLSKDDLFQLLSLPEIETLSNITLVGLMGMGTFTDDEAVTRAEFDLLKSTFDEVKSKFPFLGNSFSQLSMGMSDDYPIAIEAGSTMVRIGSAIFGNRIYL